MSDDTSLKQRLLALAAASERSTFQRVRDVFPEIETAIEAGVPRADIVAALQAEGIDISPKVFTNYVQRLRMLKAKASVREAANEPPPKASARRGTR